MTTRKRDESPTPATKLLEKDDVESMDSEGEKEVKYPKSVFFIMGNEFCERFSYYGMRTVLTLYLTMILQFSDDKATVIYHAFTMLCYFTPLFGAIISDSLLGKYKTIFYISIVYAIGNVTLSIASIPDLHLPLIAISMLGLVLIGVGTGGIKPCVAAFGGDQFVASQEKQRQQFFSVFYFSINAGSLLSTFLTPLLRSSVKCFEADTCYPLAFGVPAVLMVVSLMLFVCGRPFYKIIPPHGNILIDVTKCIFHALGRRISSSSEKRDHWLDYADDKFDKSLIQDVKAVMRVLFMLLPLPFFWALFDQQGSRWTLQATRMDGSIPGTSYVIQPDQIQMINPMLIIAMIPVFEILIYPLLTKCHLLTRPLQRISVGGMLAGLSFVVAGFVQLALEQTLPVPPAAGTSEVSVINSLPCDLNIMFQGSAYNVPHLSNLTLTNLDSKVNYSGIATFSPSNNKLCSLTHNVTGILKFYPESEKAFTMALGLNDKNSIAYFQSEEFRKKAHKGKSDVRFVYNLLNPGENATIYLKGLQTKKEYNISFVDNSTTFGLTNYTLIEPDEYKIYFPLPSENINEAISSFVTKQGGVYTIILFNLNHSPKATFEIINTVEANTMSMLFQVPQYLIITLGEIMFSITGLEFCYSQAPTSMKSVLQAAWLLTVAFGNLIVVIIAEAEIFQKQSYEFFLFAILMGIDMIIFIIMAYFYVYVTPQESSNPIHEDEGTIKEKDNGTTNLAYEDDTRM